MSASSLSMAAAVAASSPLHNKLSTLSLTHPSIFVPANFPSSPKYLKPLKLSPQICNPLSIPLPRLRCAFTAFEETTETEDDELALEEEQKTFESSEAGKLFVGNLPYSVTSSQLTEVFEQAGQVISAEVIYDRVTDRSRGFGFVTMGSVEEAKEAIRMLDGSQVGGRTVKVNFPEVPRGGEREVMVPKVRNSYKGFNETPYQVYAGNLSWSVTSESLSDAFADQPGMLSAKVIYERGSGRSRGYGFVAFESAEAAESALNAMNGVELEGRPLRLNVAVQRASPRPAAESDTETNLDHGNWVSSTSSLVRQVTE